MKKANQFLMVVMIIAFAGMSITLAAQTNETKKQTPDKKKGVYEKVEKMPEYPGGMDAMMNFISSNIKYPVKAKEGKVTGMVKVKFIVNADGAVSDVEAESKIGSGCEEEAVRVVKLMPKWTPGQEKGKNVAVYFSLPVKFALK